MRTPIAFILVFTLIPFNIPKTKAQPGPGYWQQQVDYEMEIDMDAEEHEFDGEQTLRYTNNSPDTLHQVFYHLYFNAFQPGSMMDVRSRTIEDPDSRVGDRIAKLDEDEIGYQRIEKLKQDGKKLDHETVGTILEVELHEPILPGESSSFEMEFHGQVPLQIRRSGRDNDEGIAFSMSQWYPKMAEYDEHGWHPDPYVGREFHPVWGDFDVSIHMDSSYVIGGTGTLQNPEEVGHGYVKEGQVERPDQEKLTWHFQADSVHDFMWAADKDYEHDIHSMDDGPELHFFYQPDPDLGDWERLQEKAADAFRFMNEHFGEYPYESYSFIQGGDGGMEYPMATLITGHRSFGSLVGVSVHELIHSWYQGVLASNENMYPWMDEGFTTYASNLVMDQLFDRDQKNPHRGSYRSYFSVVERDKEEPMSVHADAYHTNMAYGVSAYAKGNVFLSQLEYVVGTEPLLGAMKRYFHAWKFKHPEPRDFKRIVEKESGMQLDWYFMYWLNTTRTCDHGIKEVRSDRDRSHVVIEDQGKIPMPLEVEVEYVDGESELYYIPLEMMRGKKAFKEDEDPIVLEERPWPYPEYEFTIDRPEAEIERIEIDPSGYLADIEREDNVYPSEDKTRKKGEKR